MNRRSVGLIDDGDCIVAVLMLDSRLEFKARTKETVQSCDALMLLYSVDSEESFLNVNVYLQEMLEARVELSLFPMLLFANKTDLGKREVSARRGVEYAWLNGLAFLEGSAKDGTNVCGAFERLLWEAECRSIVTEDRRNRGACQVL